MEKKDLLKEFCILHYYVLRHCRSCKNIFDINPDTKIAQILDDYMFDIEATIWIRASRRETFGEYIQQYVQ